MPSIYGIIRKLFELFATTCQSHDEKDFASELADLTRRSNFQFPIPKTSIFFACFYIERSSVSHCAAASIKTSVLYSTIEIDSDERYRVPRIFAYICRGVPINPHVREGANFFSLAFREFLCMSRETVVLSAT